MTKIQNPKLPSDQKFGYTIGLVLLTTSGYGYFQLSHVFTYCVFAAAILFLLSTVFFPSFLKPINVMWFELGLFLGRVVGPITLGLIYFLLITPTAFVIRLFGRDELMLRKRNVSSYWIYRSQDDRDSFESQF